MNPRDFDCIEQLGKIKQLCSRIFQDQKDIEAVKELKCLIGTSRSTVIKPLEKIIFPSFFPILKNISEDKSKNKFKEKEKQEIVDTFKELFKKIKIDNLALFFNIYGFLLFEIYDHNNHCLLKISEEYKLSLIECMTELSNCLSSSVIEQLYVKQNAPKLCQMIFAVLEVAKTEEFKTLRVAAINCIMSIAHVLNDQDFNDLVLRNQIADVFLFFLPGLASQLKFVALVDEKYGHKIPCIALKAWGRLVTLLMQDYNASDQQIHLIFQKTQTPSLKKFKNEKDMKEYIENVQRLPEWYKENDRKLQQIIVEFSTLTHHSHPKVRLELVNIAELLLENCVNTMPTSVGRLVDIIIILSEDSDDFVSEKSRKVLDCLSEKLGSDDFKTLLDNLEENFYNVIVGIPRKFNRIDERVQIVALNSLIGYISLFGKYRISQILQSTVHLNKLLLTLLHIVEFDRNEISILEEYSSPDYDLSYNLKISCKKFRLFKDITVLKKIETLCQLLTKFEAAEIVSDFLLDIIASDSEQKKEAIFLLNETIAGMSTDNYNITTIKNVVSTYTDGSFWYLPLTVMVDDDGFEHTLSDVQSNIIQVCLLVEGLGKIAAVLQNNYQQFMLKTLYLVMERAGSAHPIIQSAGLFALSNISKAFGYKTITDLINNNIDYFSFHIERRLNRAKGDSGVLDVLAVVIKYSTKDVLNSTCEVVNELLLRTYDKHRNNLKSYFHVFKMFIMGLHKWLEVESEITFKTKKQKIEAFEEFKVSDIEPIEDFSDDIMGKSAEELYKEDMEKTKKEIEEETQPFSEEYKKPVPPTHIKLTAAILNRSLHYLPSKDKTIKLLVLEILKNGAIVLQNWEDELLPIVHQIWSPLVDRFKETDEPVIVNFSFQLLVTLAKLSKEFIRSRTANDVLPNILTILNNLAKESYLKDKGSAYRYSQHYKLQLTILENLGRVITDLDMLQKDVDKSMEAVFRYLSDKQPIPLQTLAVEFFKLLITYDLESTKAKLNFLIEDATIEFEKNIKTIKVFL